MIHSICHYSSGISIRFIQAHLTCVHMMKLSATEYTSSRKHITNQVDVSNSDY